jgi:hypothetical protein
MPVRSGVAGEVFGGLVAEVFHAVAPLDQRHTLGGKTLQFDRADFGAVLVALAALLRLLIVVEFTFDALVGAVEEIDGRPQEILEVRFEAGFAQARDESVEDVGDGGRDDAGLRQRPWVGLVLEGAIAMELELGEDVIGRGCGERQLVVGLVMLDRHDGFPWLDRPRSSRPSWRRKAAGGPDLHRRAQRSGRSKAEDGGSRLFCLAM